jgi:tetrahydromethanopterin S-methyltransferase subunit E
MSIRELAKKTERADGDVPADAWATAIIKVACILVIGVVILNSVVSTANVSTGPFAGLMTTVNQNISSGYTLAALMVLAIGAGAIMHFLGFM